MASALDRALAGEKVTGSAAVSAAREGAKKLKGLKARAETWKANGKRTGGAALHAAEQTGAGIASAWAEGYYGKEKLEVRGTDARPVVGLLAAGFGLWRLMNGKKGGAHLVSIGAGFVDGWALPAALRNGQKMRAEKAAGGAAVDSAGKPVESLAGLREINLDDELAGITPSANRSHGNLVELRVS